MKIAVMHPGAMGESVGLTMLASGVEVLWLAEGRSPATAGRAKSFTPVADLTELSAQADAIVSVCPPEAALHQGRLVLESGFRGLYLDGNAVSPATADELAGMFGERYIDGGIIGPPAHQPGTTRLYLAGSRAEQALEWFSAGPLNAVVLSNGTGAVDATAASALKMCYAAWTKGSSALLLAVAALARANGVEDALRSEWDLSQPGVGTRLERTAGGTAPKAWRFVGEMQEIAATFAASDLPEGFHAAAAQVYSRMSGFKDTSVDLDQVLTALLDQQRS